MPPITDPVDNSINRLLKAFIETEYRIFTGPSVRLRIGNLQPQLDAFAGSAGWAIVTADNPGATMQSESDNQAARARLESRLQTIQTGERIKTVHHASDGLPQSRWPEEQGWLFGFERPDQIHALAREFEQAGVVVGAPGQAATLWLYGGGWADTLPNHVQQVGV